MNHHGSLYQVSIDRIPHPRTSSLYFEPTAPFIVVRVYFVAQFWFPIFTEKYRTVDFFVLTLALLYIESCTFQLRTDLLKHFVTFQAIIKTLGSNLALVGPERSDNLTRKLRRSP